MFEQELRGMDLKIERINKILELVNRSCGDATLSLSFPVKKKIHFSESLEPVKLETRIDENGYLEIEEERTITKNLTSLNCSDVISMLDYIKKSINEQKSALDEKILDED